MRGTRKLALTESGEAYLASCRRILEALAEAERGASGEYNAPQGELVITAPVTLGRLHVVPVAAEFLAAHQRVDLRLVLSDRPLNLIDDHLDLALRVGELPDSSLVALRIGKFAASSAPAQAIWRARYSEISRCPCGTRLRDVLGARLRRTVGFPDGHEIHVRSRTLEVSTAEAALDAASCGIGMHGF